MSLAWLRDMLAPGEDLASFTSAAIAAPPAARGLLFLPFLMGNAAPEAAALLVPSWDSQPSTPAAISFVQCSRGSPSNFGGCSRHGELRCRPTY